MIIFLKSYGPNLEKSISVFKDIDWCLVGLINAPELGTKFPLTVIGSRYLTLPVHF